MATKKSTKKGIGGIFAQLLAITVMLAAAFAFFNINDIKSFDDLVDFATSESKKASECSDKNSGNWTCADVKVPDINSELPEFKDPDESKLPELKGSDKKDSSTDKKDSSKNKNDSEPVKDIKEQFKNALDVIPTINTKPSNEGYNRKDWPHWVGSPCNTRQEILKEQGNKVKEGEKCKIISGEWKDLYGDETITDPSKLDIDHVIPLAYASRHGGSDWSKDKKKEFANDKTQLFAVSASENRKKGDSGPSEYMPSNGFECTYSKVWIATAHKYDLTITKDDKKALEKGLKKC